MLEVMNAGSMELARGSGDRGIFLDCWDKSPPLIKELERTVSFAERKCGDLMQQLHFYKEYYEKWAQVERINHLCHKKKVKKNCRQKPLLSSSSENELENRNQSLYKKIKTKINEANEEITQANRKIQSRKETVTPLPLPSPAQQLKKNSQSENELPQLEKKACKSEPMMTSSGKNCATEGLKVTKKQSSKSVPTRNKISRNIKRDSGAIKRRFSHLQRYKIRSKSLPQGVRRKFGFGGFFEVFEPETMLRDTVRSRSKSRTLLKADSSKSFKSRKSKTRLSDVRRLTPRTSRHRIAESTSETKYCLINSQHESETKSIHHGSVQPVSVTFRKVRKEENTCKAIVPSTSTAQLCKTDFNFGTNLKNLIVKPNTLIPFLRHPIPFIPCSSTSKSFNLGLNIQQVLSLIKNKRHSMSLQAIVRSSIQAARSITEPTVNTLFISQTTASHSHVTSAICPAREGSEDSFSILSDNRSKCSILKQVQTMRSEAIEDKVCTSEDSIVESHKPERPEDVWVVEQPDSRKVKNARSKCTCFPSKHCVDYHKVLKQYTGWRLPAISQKGTRSSYLCNKSKLYAIPSHDNLGFGMEDNDGKMELTKVQNDLLNLTRKYSSLQEQISQKGMNDFEANAELEAMESELVMREIELKDIINFYNKLMVLKENVKYLRTRKQPPSRQPDCPRTKKVDPSRPTPSMALAKVLKKIQGLQDKIKLMDAP